uniref:hypothetical protein n=1 Tax=Parerythrobacter lutipelagi TaxID=1964208 RepID=UPI0010F90231|nr:hypothetical protein [Parerythrobacter lutipelagi]
MSEEVIVFGIIAVIALLPVLAISYINSCAYRCRELTYEVIGEAAVYLFGFALLIWAVDQFTDDTPISFSGSAAASAFLFFVFSLSWTGGYYLGAWHRKQITS